MGYCAPAAIRYIGINSGEHGCERQRGSNGSHSKQEPVRQSDQRPGTNWRIRRYVRVGSRDQRALPPPWVICISAAAPSSSLGSSPFFKFAAWVRMDRGNWISWPFLLPGSSVPWRRPLPPPWGRRLFLFQTSEKSNGAGRVRVVLPQRQDSLRTAGRSPPRRRIPGGTMKIESQKGTSSADAAGTTNRATTFFDPALSKSTASLSPSIPATAP